MVTNRTQLHRVSLISLSLYYRYDMQSFNPKDNMLIERGELPQDMVTSDLTAWAWNKYIYITGGFTAVYTAVGNTYHLDLADDCASFDDMQYSALATSPNPCDDIQAVELIGYAYMAGGLTHTSFWCEALINYHGVVSYGN